MYLLLNLVAFGAGILLVGLIPRLPSPALALTLAAIALACCSRRRLRPLGAALLGAVWACVQGQAIVALPLPEVCSKLSLNVQGVITGLPQVTPQGIKFEFSPSAIGTRDHVSAIASANSTVTRSANFSAPVSVSATQASACAQALDGYDARLLLYYRLPQGESSHNSEPSPPEWLVPGQRLTLEVRLTPARGLANFGGFDYELWLLRQGIGARGSVTALASPQVHGTNWSVPAQNIDKWRWQLSRWLAAQSLDNTGVLVALLIGENDFIAPDVWRLWARTGISHLVAVSGLHIGFVAIVGFALGRFLGRLLQLSPWLRLRRWVGPAARMGALTSLAAAGFYSALAGFNIPTLRTFVMIALFNLCLIFYRRVPLWTIYGWALCITLLLDPLAGYDMGFWLSFTAVALLIFHFGGRRFCVKQSLRVAIGIRVLARRLGQFIASQWLMLVGLFLPLALLVNTVPLLAPITNLLAIPVVTFVVVPLLLLAALLQALAWLTGFNWLALIAAGFVHIADSALTILSAALVALLERFDAWATPVVAFDGVTLMLVGLLSLLLLIPRSFKAGRLLASVAFALVGIGLLKDDTRAPLEIVILDVGQGSAAVILVGDYTLVVDIGPVYSPRFSAATGVLMPYLARRGISEIDDLVISHWDQDHAGDFDELTRRLPIKRVLAGESPPQLPPQLPHQYRYASPESFASPLINCHTHPSWQVGSVNFKFLRDHTQLPAPSRNDRSCVLLIEVDGQKILLPGDLSRAGEWQLLRGQELPADIDLLVAGHHGSRGSSNPAFNRYLNPRWVVYSSGAFNRYGHPHTEVTNDFAAIGSTQLNTALDGAVRYRYWPEDGASVESARQMRHRYWQAPAREFK